MKIFSKVIVTVAFAAMLAGSVPSVAYARPDHHFARRVMEAVYAACHRDGACVEDGVCNQDGICVQDGVCNQDGICVESGNCYQDDACLNASDWCDGYGGRSYSHHSDRHSGRGHRSGCHH